MKTLVRNSKTKTYINFNGEFFVTNNDWANKEILPVDFSKINDQQKEAINSIHGWQDIGDHSDLQSAYYYFIGLEKIRKEEGKAKTEEFRKKIEAERNAEWAKIKDLEVIPSTLENIRTVLLHLNSQNWGGWVLPKMSISYSVNQYDCDGVSASTMKLDKPVDGDKLFKVGGKRGHLNKYRSL